MVVVSDYSKGISRAKYQKELQKSGRISKLEFTKTMSAFQVKGVIVRGFQDLPVDQVCHCSTIRYSLIATWDADLRGK